jgi:RNA polymerase sigma-70 factor (ECF subfamily)
MRERDDELAALARAAGRGNTAAFDSLVRRIRERVLAWAQRVTSDADEAEDVAQLVLLKLHAHIDRFEGRSRFSTWLFRVTRNVSLSRAHREHRRRELAAGHAAGHEADRVAGDADITADTGSEDPRPDHLALLLRYYEDLPDRQREVFELGDLRGFNSTEIASRLGITPSTARGLLMKARRRIRLRMLESHPELLTEYSP